MSPKFLWIKVDIMTWESPIIAFDAIYFLTKNKAEAWEEIIVCIKQIWKE